ncbi:SPFH domain-containing protein, partial [Acinetobacter baumannii]
LIRKVTNQRIMDIGTRTTGGSSLKGDSTMMLTGDENIVDLHFAVYWRVKLDDLRNYLFNIAEPETTVREVSESVMREVVGQTPLQALLTE